MLAWISANSDLLNLAANVAMVAIWLAYFQVFLRGFRRQTKPKIVINLAAGSTLDAVCFVSNMSSEAIYIESVLVAVNVGDDMLSWAVTDLETVEDDTGEIDPKQRTHQGPLGSAQYASLGRFDDLMASVARGNGRKLEDLKSSTSEIMVEITIVADYASESMLIGAKRRFRARWEDGHWKLAVATRDTEQIRSRRERQQLYDLVMPAG